ncbi:MAG: PKD domain-containing protein [Desulfococcaceae bacterium]
MTIPIQNAQTATLEVTATADDAALVPPNGISVTGGGATRILTVLPEAEESGQTRIRIEASDDSGTDTVDFLLEVFAINDAPTAEVPDTQEVDEGESLTFGTAEGNAIVVDDIDAGTNSVETEVTAENGTLEAAANGGATIAGNETGRLALFGRISQINDALDGLVYSPNADFFGTDVVEVRIDDKGHTGEVDNPFETPEKVARASFEVAVQPVNDPPEIDAPESAETLEDTPLVFSADNENAITVSDIDAGDEPVRVTVAIEDGLLSVSDENADAVAGQRTSEITFSAPQETANAILDGLTARVGPVETADGGLGEPQLRTPSNWSGNTVLEIVVNDQGHTGAGGPLSAEWTLPVEATSVNDAPTISLSSPRFVLDEDDRRLFGSEAVVIRDVDAGDNPIRLALNWTEGDLTVPETDEVDRLDTGERSVELEGSIADLNDLLGDLIFTPEPDWNGEAELTIAADDQGHSGEIGEAKTTERILTLAVRPVPDAPVLEDVDTIEMTPIEMNAENPSGELVSDLLAGRVSDADENPDEIGMAVVFAENDSGEWQFSTDDGRNWTPFPEGTNENASVLLGPDARIRFVPEADWEGFAELDFRPWDGSDGAASGAMGVNIVEVGGEAPFGAEIGMLSILVGDPPPLVADAGPNQTVVEGDTVTLDGSGSQTPTEVTTAFFWEQIAGPSVSLSDPLAIQPTFVVPEIGPEGEEFIFRLTLTAEGLPESSDDVRVSATQDMTVVADAGDDLAVPENTEVVLDGSGSRIPDGVTVGVEWTQTAGPEVTIGNATTLTPFFTSPAVDQDTALVFRLILTDPEGNEIADSVQITVTDQPAIRADAGPDQTVEEGATVTLNGTGSFVESGVAALYQWTQTAGPSVSLANPAAAETTFVAPDVAENQSETLVFTLEVRDNAGTEVDTDDVAIQVLDAGPTAAPPAADAGSNQRVAPGSSVTLSGTGSSDSDGTIVAYQWTQESGPSVALSNAAAATTTFTAPAETATLRFRLAVTDNGGLTDQDTVTITVADDTPPGPGAGEPAEFREGETVRLNVSPSPDFGAATGYRWTQVSGTTVPLSDPNVQRPTFVPPPETVGQTLAFEVVLTNAQGRTQNATQSIRVLDNGITGFPDDAITFRPTNQHTMGIRMSGAAALVALEPVDVGNTDTDGRPANLPFGLVAYTFRVATPGDSAAATIFPQTPQPNSHQWFLYDDTGGWREYGDNASLNDDGTRLTLTVADGGPGDEDGVANGLVRHTGGLGSDTPTGPGSDGGGGGAGDSGCFIRALLGSE